MLALSAVGSEPSVDVIRDRVFVQRDSGPLAMDLYLPKGEGPFPGMLVVHGGAWTIGTRSQLAAAALTMAKHGYAAAAVSYRLAPKDRFPAQVHDCQAAVRWLREHAGQLKIDPTRIGGYGYSAGGHLVALLGALDDDDLREEGVSANAPSARLQAVLAGATPCDFRVLPPGSKRLAYWLGGTPATRPDAYRNSSPASFASPDDPPMFFFHGEIDHLVPIESQQRMVEVLTDAGVTAEMYTVPKAGHIQPVFDTEALRRAIAFADRFLKSERPGGGDAPARSEFARRAGPSARLSSPQATAPVDSPKGGASHGQ